ncbi:IS200/IS605 family element transposase accessory protein TnpB [Nonomuraea turkmeniaca]|uniref:IS200/IS605 family element transposase accessory protein TnpB n=1 Tax=Nonomuraea turkmeniaca TaxID=103838 RepID=A0A5S4F1R7_9ACTN|nr:IS200/IS605 family element transposase accessory protein TnpB [Nonomuraea turkmeniaca]TMR09924.1 IS200/IS605 family element transposase accessory protein TnpB [Nonomuraea turkmeniaca]
MTELRPIEAPFVAPGPSGVAVRDRLKNLTVEDEQVLRLVGAHLGALASGDLKTRCADGLEHDNQTWAARKRGLTELSSSRWAGTITKASHDQWVLARRCQAAHIADLEAGIATIGHRLSLPVGEKGTRKAPGGYRSRQEWHAKSRRLRVLQDRLQRERADQQAGIVHIVRGGKRLVCTRHHLDAAGLTEAEWRHTWEAARWFLAADGESGKRYGNETIRITPDGEVSIRLPAPLAHLANAPHGRYVLACRVGFAQRGSEWADRIEANRAVAYRIHLDVRRGCWYITASLQIPPAPAIPLQAALAHGVIGVDTNADHLAAWRLDSHGNPIGNPRRFSYDLSGSAEHRDAQVRHALTRLLHWAKACGVSAIAIEDLNFRAEKTREKHGRRKRLRQLISGMPTSRLRARLTAMADATGIVIIAADPAYTSRWGAQHWQTPLTSNTRTTTRHDAAAVAIGRRALGHPIRRRTAPPRTHQSDGSGHRTVQAAPGTLGREETRRPVTDRAHDAPARARRTGTRATSASNTVRDARSTGTWVQHSLLDTA